jgi:hypothetical protein
MFGSDEDEAKPGEVHQWMTAHRAETDDGPPAPCPHLDLIGTRGDLIANGPFTGGSFVVLISQLPSHLATPFVDVPRPSFAARGYRRTRSWRPDNPRRRPVRLRWRTAQTGVRPGLGTRARQRMLGEDTLVQRHLDLKASSNHRVDLRKYLRTPEAGKR